MRALATLALAALAVLSASAEDWLAAGRKAHAEGRWAEAVEALTKDTDLYPEHVEAYRLLAEAFENLGKADEAKQAWRDFRALAKSPEDRRLADEKLGAAAARSAFEVDAKTVEEIKAVSGEWHTKETEHFTVRSHNRRLTEVVAGQAEGYLAMLCRTFLNGAAYPHKLPLTIYADQQEYVGAGNPDWSQGGTAVGYESMDAFITGKVTRKIDLLHRVKGELNPDLVKPKLLPHELTHLVLAEHYGERRIPLWLNEGTAQYYGGRPPGGGGPRPLGSGDQGRERADPDERPRKPFRLPGQPRGHRAVLRPERLLHRLARPDGRRGEVLRVPRGSQEGHGRRVRAAERPQGVGQGLAAVRSRLLREGPDRGGGQAEVAFGTASRPPALSLT